MPALVGKRVLITGASSGIGAAAALEFALEGADVALVARSREGLERVAERVRATGVRAHVVAVDLCARDAVEAAVAEAVAALGGLDILVWNAASMVFGRFSEVDPADFDRTIDITFRAAVNTVRATLPHLERSRGAIVATGSVNARIPLGCFASYASAKHALRGFLGSLRIEMRERRTGVTVSMVHPGPVDTPLWHNVSSATDVEPRNPPDTYSAETIARALVALAIRPRAEVTIGGEARLIEVLFAAARPVADLVLVLVDRYYATGREPVPGRGGLWEPQGVGRPDGGLHGRPSVWGALRLGSRMRRGQRNRPAVSAPTSPAAPADGEVSVNRGAGVSELGAPVQRTTSPP
jgi:NAD(P)-dependent dehydrogenase (short-subunit alcohol dehydrogenase family)